MASVSATASASASPWIPRTTSILKSSGTSPPSSASKPTSSSCSRFLCCRRSPPAAAATFKFALHDALDSAGINILHAREARRGFASQIEKLSDIERQTSITINRCVDLGKTALFIAAEDDSLISHSSVPLPVDAFIDRLDDLSMGYCSNYSSSFRSSPESLLDSLENYLYVKKGFQRSNSKNHADPRSLYLHSVLTHRSGSAVMLSLVYSEILKMLKLWGLLDFDCEIFFPHDLDGLPRGYNKQKSKESDHLHIMTSHALLEEILRNLKEAFWPFQHNKTRSLFLRAADAANYSHGLNNDEESGFQLASAKAAQHRLDRGVWTSVRLGDMRRALSACERLIILEAGPQELRDYGVLLYHCGLYEQALQYLKLYQETKSNSIQRHSFGNTNSLEEEALERLFIRLNLISMEVGWSKPSHVRNPLGNNSEPW